MPPGLLPGVGPATLWWPPLSISQHGSPGHQHPGTGDPAQAEECTQETFIKVYDRLGTFRGEAALSTWITSVAVSVVLNGMRAAKRRREREHDLEQADPWGWPKAPRRQISPGPGNNQGVPTMIRLARTDKDPGIRKQAIFWLGQSGDRRAIEFFEEVLPRRQ